MKKTKILLPLMGLSTITVAAPIVTSCNNYGLGTLTCKGEHTLDFKSSEEDWVTKTFAWTGSKEYIFRVAIYEKDEAGEEVISDKLLAAPRVIDENGNIDVDFFKDENAPTKFIIRFKIYTPHDDALKCTIDFDDFTIVE